MGPHVCDNCGARSAWTQDWQWFGSYIDMEDGAIARLCSEACRAEATVPELNGLVRRRRAHQGVDHLLPLRDHRAVHQDALPIDLTKETP